MTKITRYDGNLKAFAANAGAQERVVFGDDTATPTESDDLTVNIDSNFLRGWATLPLGEKPPREWFNSVAFVPTQLAAYLHQMGIAEYNAAQEYHTNSLANYNGRVIRCTADNTVGADPADGDPWEFLTGVVAQSMADLRTKRGYATGELAQLVSYYDGWAAVATPPIGGGVFTWDADSTDTDDGGKIIACTGVPTGRWVRLVETAATPHMFGKQINDAANDAAQYISAALTAFDNVVLPPDQYRLNNPINPKNGKTLRGIRGKSILLQYGQFAVEQDAEDLEYFKMQGVTFDFRDATASRYYEAIKLLAHKYCGFDDLEFIRYDDQTIMTRMPSTSAGINTVDNEYTNWRVSAAAHISISIGLEGYYYTADGDGSTTVFNTNIVWPETFNSSVVVVKENANRLFVEQDLTTDYTVSYDGSDNLTITFVTAPASNERIHIWPSQPRTDGNRRPISNNTWRNLHCDYVFLRGHTCVRWVDGEDDFSSRYLLASDSAAVYDYNPYKTRKGEGGDFMGSYNCVLSYREAALVPNPNTLYGYKLGPGSRNIYGSGIIMDLVWRHSGSNKAVNINDGKEIALTGTVSITSGLPTVTGTGTAFRDEVTLVGSTPDVIIIGGTKYGISSIDSDTQITLTANASATLSGETAYRYNFGNSVAYDIAFAGTGDGQNNSNDKTMGRVFSGSNYEASGEAVILSGATSVDVSVTLARAPRVGEIVAVPHSGINGRSIQISNITATSFRININTAAAADYTFGWRVKLDELN